MQVAEGGAVCGGDQGALLHLPGRACVVLEMWIGEGEGERAERQRAAGGMRKAGMECCRRNALVTRRLADYAAGSLFNWRRHTLAQIAIL